MATGVANADAIMGVPGVDVGFVSHTDLSVSLASGQFDIPPLSPPAMPYGCRRKHKGGRLPVATPDGPAVDRSRFRLVTYLGIWLLANALRAGPRCHARGAALTNDLPRPTGPPARRRVIVLPGSDGQTGEHRLQQASFTASIIAIAQS
jgi:hypothetical protein